MNQTNNNVSYNKIYIYIVENVPSVTVGNGILISHATIVLDQHTCYYSIPIPHDQRANQFVTWEHYLNTVIINCPPWPTNNYF